MTPTEQELRGAVERVEDILRCTTDMGHEEDREAIQLLINLAYLHLSAKSDLPEKFKDVVASEKYPLQYYEGRNDGVDECIPIVARLKAENEELKQELEVCRDANVQKKKQINSLESALKRAEGKIPSIRDIEKCLYYHMNTNGYDMRAIYPRKKLAEAIHALLTTRRKDK